jgi:hypothetical protein
MFDMGDFDPMRKVWLVRLGFHEESLTWEILIPRGKFDMGDFDPTRKGRHGRLWSHEESLT